MSKKKNDGFNTPFANLKSLIKDEKKSAPQKSGTSSPSTKAPKKVDVSEEERAFLQAMGGVQPLAARKELPGRVKELTARVASEDAEALAQLYDLVSERGDFQLSVTADSLSGMAPGVDERLLNALRKGEFGPQAQVEVQGLSKLEAKDAVDALLSQSKREGKRSALISHGLELAALKDELKVWLDKGRLGKLALAFCTARPQDGGKSALYVLLRR